MDASIWVAIYLPIFIVFVVIIPNMQMQKAALLKIKQRRSSKMMTNEMIKKYLGKDCKVSTGSFGINVVGKIIDVNENWLEIETRKNKELVNIDFIQSIKEK